MSQQVNKCTLDTIRLPRIVNSATASVFQAPVNLGFIVIKTFVIRASL